MRVSSSVKVCAFKSEVKDLFFQATIHESVNPPEVHCKKMVKEISEASVRLLSMLSMAGPIVVRARPKCPEARGSAIESTT